MSIYSDNILPMWQLSLCSLCASENCTYFKDLSPNRLIWIIYLSSSNVQHYIKSSFLYQSHSDVCQTKSYIFDHLSLNTSDVWKAFGKWNRPKPQKIFSWIYRVIHMHILIYKIPSYFQYQRNQNIGNQNNYAEENSMHRYCVSSGIVVSGPNNWSHIGIIWIIKQCKVRTLLHLIMKNTNCFHSFSHICIHTDCLKKN